MLPGAVACWVFLSCLEVLQTCDKFTDTGQMEAYSLHTASLWDYARNKVSATKISENSAKLFAKSLKLMLLFIYILYTF